MIFYVIGNGFDLHYRLKTSYHNFKQFLRDSGYDELVRTMDELFYEKGFWSSSDIQYWSEFENMLEAFNYLDAQELYDEAMDNAEDDDDRADYWDSPSWNANYYSEYITVLKQQFVFWIDLLDTDIVPDKYFSPHNNDFVLTFNYTKTIEKNFHIPNSNIVHIHGTIGTDLELGHNNYQKPNGFIIHADEDSDYRDLTTKKAVNSVLKRASTMYYKNSFGILQRYRKIFDSIHRYEKVVIMGLSCGAQDALYIKEIVKNVKHIDFYYHDLMSMENFKQYIDDPNISVSYYKW